MLDLMHIFSVKVSLRSGPHGLDGSGKRFMLVAVSVAYELANKRNGQTI